MELKNSVNDVLADMLIMLESQARVAGKEGLALLELAHQLTAPVMKLTGVDQVRGLTSIGHGLKSGLAAIANEQARALLDSLISRSLGFAAAVGKAALGMLGKLLD